MYNTDADRWLRDTRDKIEVGRLDWVGGSSKREDGGGRCDWRLFVPETRNTSVATLFYLLLNYLIQKFLPAKTLDAELSATNDEHA